MTDHDRSLIRTKRNTNKSQALNVTHQFLFTCFFEQKFFLLKNFKNSFLVSPQQKQHSLSVVFLGTKKTDMKRVVLLRVSLAEIYTHRGTAILLTAVSPELRTVSGTQKALNKYLLDK